jgi:hypothetical protein
MKKKSLVVVVLVLFVQANVFALDTLYLNIRSFAGTKLQFNAENPIMAQGNIRLSGDNWVLKITNPTNARIILSNTEGTLDSVVLDGTDVSFKIENNLLRAKNFTLQKNVRIKVREANGSRVKNFDIVIGKATPAEDVRPEPNHNRPQGGDGNGIESDYIPGSMVYDAIALADDNTNLNTKVQILTYYAAGATIDSAFNDNKFLTKVLGEVNQFIGAQSGGGLTSILSTVGGLDVTKYADGIAKFLVKRVRQ